jgi:hypothetical protein
MLYAHMVEASNIAIGIPSRIISDALSQLFDSHHVDFSSVPTLAEVLENSERTDNLKWETLVTCPQSLVQG